ncbi:MAG: triose-phosphate isomerase [Bacteroidota bacterium]|jgi:triosephosphate isomerase
MRKRILAGNWKMNCDREEALSLATEVMGMVEDEYRGDAEVVLFPSFVHIQGLSRLTEKSKIQIGAQNCSTESTGAYTGEVSASMIKSVGATHVIIGHSERRSYFDESPFDLSAKISQALHSDLTVIYCVGETLEQRKNSDHFSVVEAQLRDCLFHLEDSKWSRLVVAYEPVWAIGTGLTATPDQAQEMHGFIRQSVSASKGHSIAVGLSILYGGSCNESNAAQIFSLKDVDGGLIGGASLKSRSFVNILKCL